jgi:hypothetical protein
MSCASLPEAVKDQIGTEKQDIASAKQRSEIEMGRITNPSLI